MVVTDRTILEHRLAVYKSKKERPSYRASLNNIVWSCIPTPELPSDNLLPGYTQYKNVLTGKADQVLAAIADYQYASSVFDSPTIYQDLATLYQQKAISESLFLSLIFWLRVKSELAWEFKDIVTVYEKENGAYSQTIKDAWEYYQARAIHKTSHNIADFKYYIDHCDPKEKIFFIFFMPTFKEGYYEEYDDSLFNQVRSFFSQPSPDGHGKLYMVPTFAVMDSIFLALGVPYQPFFPIHGDSPVAEFYSLFLREKMRPVSFYTHQVDTAHSNHDVVTSSALVTTHDVGYHVPTQAYVYSKQEQQAQWDTLDDYQKLFEVTGLPYSKQAWLFLDHAGDKPNFNDDILWTAYQALLDFEKQKSIPVQLNAYAKIAFSDFNTLSTRKKLLIFYTFLHFPQLNNSNKIEQHLFDFLATIDESDYRFELRDQNIPGITMRLEGIEWHRGSLNLSDTDAEFIRYIRGYAMYHQESNENLSLLSVNTGSLKQRVIFTNSILDDIRYKYFGGIINVNTEVVAYMMAPKLILMLFNEVTTSGEENMPTLQGMQQLLIRQPQFHRALNLPVMQPEFLLAIPRHEQNKTYLFTLLDLCHHGDYKAIFNYFDDTTHLDTKKSQVNIILLQCRMLQYLFEKGQPIPLNGLLFLLRLINETFFRSHQISFEEYFCAENFSTLSIRWLLRNEEDVKICLKAVRAMLWNTTPLVTYKIFFKGLKEQLPLVADLQTQLINGIREVKNDLESPTGYTHRVPRKKEILAHFFAEISPKPISTCHLRRTN